MFPGELTGRLGEEITVALFPASLVSWRLVYIPVRDVYDMGSFTTSLVVQKRPVPFAEEEVECSFIQVSGAEAGAEGKEGGQEILDREEVEEVGVDDTISLGSVDSEATVEGNEDTDEEYILISPSTPRPFLRRGSVAMQRGNGFKSPCESLYESPSNPLPPSEPTSLSPPVCFPGPSTEDPPACDIADMQPDRETGPVEMLPGQKMLERSEGTLHCVAPGIWIPHREGLKESFWMAGEFVKRDGMGGRAFGRCLEGWGTLLGGKVGGMEGKWAGGR
jgi:hypothetical protein